LPDLEAATNVTVQEASAATTTVQWHDSLRKAEVTLVVNTTSGRPRELRHITQGANPTTLTVAYTGWNSPVTITEPPSR
jgi:hypothetical protein